MLQDLPKFLHKIEAVEVSNPKQVRSPYVAYVVMNGPHLLHIGEGKTTTRFAGLFPGSPCPKHTKAFVIAASTVLHGNMPRFYAIPCDSKADAKAKQEDLFSFLGLGGRCATWLDGASGPEPLKVVSQRMWTALKQHQPEAVSNNLDSLMRAVCQDGDVLRAAFGDAGLKAQLQRILGGYFV
ncbi:hypothetical protein D7X99_14200 [Corallococcus sp. AB032C]|uniref:hypothetical protein n=1 Tax=Corallococcus TaxID=83461 RepID=UPI000EC8E2A8|nr:MULTISPECIES: hypothetical protein [Corallococcus]NPC50281.1 hypothetical protein [Corallococcus exiguus]RKH82995.1 hypothetical protein D7X99_14200 [Corallococcus sp. AB032C]